VSRTLKAHLLLALITLIWGVTFVLVKAAIHFVTPLLFVAVRMALAAAALALIYRRHLRQITAVAVKNGAVVGLFLFLGYMFQTTGLRFTTPSKAAFLTGAAAVLVPVFLIAFWRAHIQRWRIVGILTALAGLFLMTVPAGRQAVADFANVNRGDILASGCAVAFAFHIIFVGRVIPRFPYEQIAVLQVGFAALFTAICMPLVEHPHLQWTATVVVALLVTALLCTALAFTVQAWAQQFTPASHTALIFTLEPVFAMITSYLVLGERLGMRAGAGALLIFSGVLISEMLGSGSQVQEGQESSAAG
jgi:drug/metabolite transporter (DMT)-like permease